MSQPARPAVAAPGASGSVELEGEPTASTQGAGPTISLEEHLPASSASAVAPVVAFEGLRSAEPLRRDGRHVTVRMRGGRETTATLDAGVEPDRIDDAIAARERVLVEGDGAALVVIGVVATRRGETVSVKGDRVIVEGQDEVLIRSGRAALRLRADGDVELVGSRISASSRGLFRLVGRLLRLN